MKKSFLIIFTFVVCFFCGFSLVEAEQCDEGVHNLKNKNNLTGINHECVSSGECVLLCKYYNLHGGDYAGIYVYYHFDRDSNEGVNWRVSWDGYHVGEGSWGSNMVMGTCKDRNTRPKANESYGTPARFGYSDGFVRFQPDLYGKDVYRLDKEGECPKNAYVDTSMGDESSVCFDYDGKYCKNLEEERIVTFGGSSTDWFDEDTDFTGYEKTGRLYNFKTDKLDGVLAEAKSKIESYDRNNDEECNDIAIQTALNGKSGDMCVSETTNLANKCSTNLMKYFGKNELMKKLFGDNVNTDYEIPSFIANLDEYKTIQEQYTNEASNLRNLIINKSNTYCQDLTEEQQSAIENGVDEQINQQVINTLNGDEPHKYVDIPTGEPISCNSLKETDTYKIIQQIFKWVQIAAPIMLVIFGVMDFGKAVISGDNDAMKKAQSTFVKRVIIVAALILLPYILEVLFSLLDGALGYDVSTCEIVVD